eukprot:TRINITY_DN16907_c0_g3_i2.p1 TRINITY_DN16907_c0_g3~~TRINITY_DN16907_c0_g3_i2.p1  ORF type:complete len:447 (-),score=61.72 TRINITY_DN16907_c0_g3_i2:250-1590(-)
MAQKSLRLPYRFQKLHDKLQFTKLSTSSSDVFEQFQYRKKQPQEIFQSYFLQRINLKNQQIYYNDNKNLYLKFQQCNFQSQIIQNQFLAPITQIDDKSDEFSEAEIDQKEEQKLTQQKKLEGFLPTLYQIQIWLEQDCKIDLEQRIAVKMLFFEEQISKILGSHGRNQKTWKEKYEVDVEASNQDEHYLGTGKRILQLQGKALELFQTLAEVVRIVEQRAKEKKAARKNLAKNYESEQSVNLKFVLILSRGLCTSLVENESERLNYIKEITNSSISLQNMNSILPGQIDRQIFIQSSDAQNLFLAIAHVTSAVAENNTELFQQFVNKGVKLHQESFWIPQAVQKINQHGSLFNAVNTVKISLSMSDLKIVREHREKINQICFLTIAPTGFFLKGRLKDVLQAQAFIAHRLNPEDQKSVGVITPKQQGEEEEEEQVDLASYLRSKLN